jgi:predicted transcriptional regulator with HTH domain
VRARARTPDSGVFLPSELGSCNSSKTHASRIRRHEKGRAAYVASVYFLKYYLGKICNVFKSDISSSHGCERDVLGCDAMWTHRRSFLHLSGFGL